ncbi:MAG: FAD-dependent oxidoreductase [Rubrivivax sp.]|jgi:sulfite dehydrogenase|nr:FAD-dependent oxidoreductase [Rubrivivax sp.]
MSNAFELSRRRLLGAGAALSGIALAGCATGGASGPSIGRVVVVGGGFGGSTAARYLKMWGGNVDVTLVERNAQFVSCPISNYVIGGHAGMDRITRGYGGLKAMGVKLVQGEVTAIDAAAKKIRLKDGSEIAYDRLVLSPGIGFMSEQTGGLQPLLDNGRVLHSWQAGPQTAALRAQLEAMPDGGVFAMTIPKVPYRCPPGPYERACMVASYFKQAKPKSKVLVLDANPEVQSKKALFERAFKQHYEGILEYRANNEVREVSVSGSQLVAKLEFDDVRADVLNVIPAQRAGDLARNTAGLVNVNNRWVGVNWLTMESTAMPGVHVLGDATFSAPAMPKSGHMANQHAKVAAAAIIQLLKGEAVSATPVVMNTCYSFVTKTDVVHVASVHQYDAADKTFKTVPGSGGVSAAANQIEGRYALSWADNIWADMLAV